MPFHKELYPNDIDTMREAREAYVTGDLSLREIASEFSLNWYTLRERARVEHWKAARRDYRLKKETRETFQCPPARRIGKICYLCQKAVTHGSYGEDGLGVYHLHCRLRSKQSPVQYIKYGESMLEQLEQLSERLELELRIQVL
jgi:hypothetical protein